MKEYLEITGCAQSIKDPSKEAIKIKVNKVANLSSFALLDNTYNNGSLSNLHIHMFVLPHPTKLLAVGDVIIVSTGKHKNESIESKDGKNHTHYIYTQTEAPRWNNDGDSARLIRFMTEDYMVVKPIKPAK